MGGATLARLSRLIGDDREQTPAEELANSLSHGLGLVLAVASLPVLLNACNARGSRPLDIAGVCAYSASMMLVYAASTLYHALPAGRLKALANRWDHAAIYLFIAGSYTPFALGALKGGLGWTLCALVWLLALLGTLAKLLNRLSHPLVSTGLYIAMGWIAVFAAGPLMQHVAPAGVALLVAGGVAYTLGALVFLFGGRLRYGHFIWHLFVLAGSACHFCATLWHARP
jgi:hemolysin III